MRATGNTPFTDSRTHTAFRSAATRGRADPGNSRRHASAFANIGTRWNDAASSRPGIALATRWPMRATFCRANRYAATASPMKASTRASRFTARRVRSADGLPPLAQELEEFHAFAQPPSHHLGASCHLAHDRRDLAGAEIEAAIERLDRVEDLGVRQVRVG